MMVNQPALAVVTLMLDVVPEAAQEPFGWRCPRCREELELHQPDAANPDRLLGTCGACGRWYVVDALSESQSLLAQIPDQAELRRAREVAAERGLPFSI